MTSQEIRMEHLDQRLGISFCTLCKGRRFHLEQTLLVNLLAIDGLNAEIILIDYHSPDDLSSWVHNVFVKQLQSKQLKVFSLIEALPFNIPIGKNFAHRLASKQFLINLDADNFIGNLVDVLDVISNNEFIACDEYGKGTYGRIGFWRSDFEQLRGYDESLEPAGWHDSDIKLRAKRSGLKRINWLCSQPAIQNDKKLTMKYIGGGLEEWRAMERRNSALTSRNFRIGLTAPNLRGMTHASFKDIASGRIEKLRADEFYFHRGR